MLNHKFPNHYSDSDLQMYAVYKDPTGKSVFNKSRPTESTSKGSLAMYTCTRKSDCLGCAVLLCLVCLFDLAGFFLSSFSSLIKNMYNNNYNNIGHKYFKSMPKKICKVC